MLGIKMKQWQGINHLYPTLDTSITNHLQTTQLPKENECFIAWHSLYDIRRSITHLNSQFTHKHCQACTSMVIYMYMCQQTNSTLLQKINDRCRKSEKFNCHILAANVWYQLNYMEPKYYGNVTEDIYGNCICLHYNTLQ